MHTLFNESNVTNGTGTNSTDSGNLPKHVLLTVALPLTILAALLLICILGGLKKCEERCETTQNDHGHEEQFIPRQT